jgi:flagellar protein FlgJ
MSTAATSLTKMAQPALSGTWGHPDNPRTARLQDQCKQFEGVLLNEMMKSMRKTVPESGGLFSAGNGQRTARDMYDERLTQSLAGRDALGIGKGIYERLMKKFAPATAKSGGDSPTVTQPLQAQA